MGKGNFRTQKLALELQPSFSCVQCEQQSHIPSFPFLSLWLRAWRGNEWTQEISARCFPPSWWRSQLGSECLSARCVHRDQCLLRSELCPDLYQLQLQRWNGRRRFCRGVFFCFITHLQQRVVSDDREVTVNYICTNSQILVRPGTAPVSCLCSRSQPGLEPPGELLKILICGPHPGPFSLESLWEGAQASMCFKVFQMLPAVPFCKPLFVPRCILGKVLRAEKLEDTQSPEQRRTRGTLQALLVMRGLKAVTDFRPGFFLCHLHCRLTTTSSA